MVKTYAQHISRFCKIAHLHYCVIYREDNDITNFLRHFFFAVMDRQNVIEFHKTPVVTVIHELTGWKKESIKKALHKMKVDVEIKKIGHNKVIFSRIIANRVKIGRKYSGDEFESPKYSEENLRLIQEIQRLIKHEDIICEDNEEMKQVLKKLDDQSMELADHRSKLADIKTILQELSNLIKQDDLPKAKSYLKLLEGGLKD